ncbi:MAG: MmcQ/YjbR family DNA-binding protein [Bacteroidota bacterium]
MNIEEFRNYCLKKPCVTEGFPFDETTLVFKVCNKMFALTGLESPELRVNLKCDPERAILLREEYSSIIPGYHMNKQHWNTVIVDGSFSDDFFKELVDDSYNLIVKGLPKKVREELL